MHFVTSGCLKVYVNEESEGLALAELKRGDYYGEACLLGKYRNLASVRAQRTLSPQLPNSPTPHPPVST